MQKLEHDGVVFYGELAEVASEISPEEWDFFELVDGISDQIAIFMDKKGVSKSQLAERMGTSRSFVTKVLSGDANMTFKTFSKLLHNLEAKPEIIIVGKSDSVRWLEVMHGRHGNQDKQTRQWAAYTTSDLSRKCKKSCSQHLAA